MKDAIHEITVGIRHRRKFGIEAIIGLIIDKILRDEEGPFVGKFTTILDIKNGKALLHSLENKDFKESTLSLSIDFDSIILTTKAKDLEKDLNCFKNDYLPYLKKTIYGEFEIDHINRIGIVFDHRLKEQKIIDRFIKVLSKENIDSANEFDLRFSRKYPENKSLGQESVVDYRNVIISLSKKSDFTKFALDYQLYFDPVIEFIGDLRFDQFIESAEKYLNNNFYKWAHEKE